MRPTPLFHMPLFVPPCSVQELLFSESFGTADSTLGPGYIGVPISALAYGITCCQAYYYYQSDRAGRDHWLLKSCVAVLMLVITCQQAFIIHAIYHYMVKNFANPCTLLQQVVWSVPADLALNTPTQIVVGGFMVYRTWNLGHNIYITGVCALLLLAASVMSIVYTVQLISLPTLLGVFTELRVIGITVLAMFALADTSTSVALVVHLYRRRTGFRRSDNLITKLIRLTISTNAFTTLITLAGLVAYVVGTHSFYITFFSFLLDKLYINAMLTALNLRNSINQASDGTSNAINSIRLSRFIREHPSQIGPGEPEANANVMVERRNAKPDSPAVPRSPLVFRSPTEPDFYNETEMA